MITTLENLDEDELDRTFAALANSTRRAILGRLADGDASVNEIAEPFDISLPAISKHLKVCLLYTSPSPRDATLSRMPSSA